MYKKKQPLSFQEVLSKLMKYCSYQERSTYEVKQKLKTYHLPDSKIDEIVDLLIQDKFIDEDRFGELYVRGKVNVKRWGKYKIKEGLASKGVNSEAINRAIETIDIDKYRENLNYLIDKKMEVQSTAEIDIAKIYRFLQSKGYEGELISNALKEKRT